MKNRIPHIFGRRLIALTVLFVLAVLLPGCSALDTMLQKDANSKSVLGDWIGNGSQPASSPGLNPSGENKTIVLYFADSTGKYLVPEERTIPKTLSLARETVTQWLRGPAVQGNSVQAAASPATTLLDIAIKDGVAIVDLSKEFGQPYGKVSPEVTLYGLANTLTQFPTVKEVKLRVEGKPLQRLGSVDATNLAYKGSLIKMSQPVSSPLGIVPKSPAAGGSGQSGSGQSGSGTAAGGSGFGSGNGGATASPSSLNLFALPQSST